MDVVGQVAETGTRPVDTVGTSDQLAGRGHPGRVASLDGLRALAVLVVLADHADLPYLNRFGGSVGVTTFFVLSGFLITRMLVAEFVRRGRLDLKAFYWRRFVRLAPALVVMVILTTIWGLLVGQGAPAVRDAVTSLLYISNWAQAVLGESVPQTSITWSLSVEEQYYLLWPLLLLPLLRHGRIRRLTNSVALLCAVSFVVRAILTSTISTDVAYRLVSVNAFPLVAGGLLAVLLATHPVGSLAHTRLRKAVGSSVLRNTLVVVLCSFLVLLAAKPLVPAPQALWIGVPVTVTTVLIIALTSLGPSIVLGFAPIAWLGRISYSLYLWHLAFLRLLPVPTPVAVAISVVAAALSWRFVEEPGRRFLMSRGQWFRRPRARGANPVTK